MDSSPSSLLINDGADPLEGWRTQLSPAAALICLWLAPEVHGLEAWSLQGYVRY